MSEKRIEVFVCTNIDCRNRGADAAFQELKQKAQTATGVTIDVKPYICFSACNIGPNVVVPEKRCWFSGVRASDANQIIEYLSGGPNLPHLQHQNEPDLEELIFAIIDAGLIPDAI